MAENMLGFDVEWFDVEGCVHLIRSHIAEASGNRWLACINPHSYVESLRDPSFASALRSADWLIPDGIGVVLASRILGGKIKRRVTGPDVFAGLHAALDQSGSGRIFFLGSSEDTLRRMRQRMEREYPNVEVAGTLSPPFRDEFSPEETDAMVQAVNSARADVLWVGMTAPKQEKWISANLHRLDVRFTGAVGAAFDFYAGKVRRPPKILQDLGLDWLVRLLQQPRRLWRRTLISAPIFMWHVFRSLRERPS